MSHLASLVLDNNRLALFGPESSLSGEDAVLELFVARVASLSCVSTISTFLVILGYLKSEMGDCSELALQFCSF